MANQMFLSLVSIDKDCMPLIKSMHSSGFIELQLSRLKQLTWAITFCRRIWAYTRVHVNTLRVQAYTGSYIGYSWWHYSHHCYCMEQSPEAPPPSSLSFQVETIA